MLGVRFSSPRWSHKGGWSGRANGKHRRTHSIQQPKISEVSGDRIELLSELIAIKLAAMWSPALDHREHVAYRDLLERGVTEVRKTVYSMPFMCRGVADPLIATPGPLWYLLPRRLSCGFRCEPCFILQVR